MPTSLYKSLSALPVSSLVKQRLIPVLWKLWAARRAVFRLLTLPALLLFGSLACCVCMEKKQNRKAPLKAGWWRWELINFLRLFQADLKSDLLVLGKPPRSPVMSWRSCSSPVRGLSGSHRVGSDAPPWARHPGHPSTVSGLALP